MCVCSFVCVLHESCRIRNFVQRGWILKLYDTNDHYDKNHVASFKVKVTRRTWTLCIGYSNTLWNFKFMSLAVMVKVTENHVTSFDGQGNY